MGSHQGLYGINIQHQGMTVDRELKGQKAGHSDKNRREGEDEAAKESELHPENRCVVCAEDQGVSDAARRKVR